MLADRQANDALKAKYPFIEDFGEPSNSLFEHIRIEGDLIQLRKRVCAKCGGVRHQLDTRGFCRDCKKVLGMPVAAKRVKDRSVVTHHHPLEPRPAQPSTAEISVDPAFINAVWGLIPSTVRLALLDDFWPRLPITLRLQLAKAGAERMNSSVSGAAKAAD
jgi:hypothetical protein